MQRANRKPCIEVIDDDMAAVLRAKTGFQRWKIVDGLFWSAKLIVESSVRGNHPDWSEAQVHREVVLRVSNGAIRLPPDGR
jgi:hypothetical protein